MRLRRLPAHNGPGQVAQRFRRCRRRPFRGHPPAQSEKMIPGEAATRSPGPFLCALASQGRFSLAFFLKVVSLAAFTDGPFFFLRRGQSCTSLTKNSLMGEPMRQEYLSEVISKCQFCRAML